MQVEESVVRTRQLQLHQLHIGPLRPLYTHINNLLEVFLRQEPIIASVASDRLDIGFPERNLPNRQKLIVNPSWRSRAEGSELAV